MNCIHSNKKILKRVSEGTRFNNYEDEYDRVDCGCDLSVANKTNIRIQEPLIKPVCPRCRNSFAMKRVEKNDLAYLMAENSWSCCAALGCNNTIVYVCTAAKPSGVNASNKYCSWRCEEHIG